MRMHIWFLQWDLKDMLNLYNSTWYPSKGAELAKQEGCHVIEYD